MIRCLQNFYTKKGKVVRSRREETGKKKTCTSVGKIAGGKKKLLENRGSGNCFSANERIYYNLFTIDQWATDPVQMEHPAPQTVH